MRKVHFKNSGVDVYIVKDGESLPKGERCFSVEEWEYAQRISKDVSDPQAEKEFWRTVLEKKMSPSYTVFDDFPKEIPQPKTLAARYTSEIISNLKTNGVKTRAEREAV